MCLQCAAYHASPFALPLSVLSLLISCLWPPPVCAENLSVGLVVNYSSHIFCSPRILGGGKTAMRKPPQQRWQDCNVGASAISFNLAAQPPWQWRWRCISNLLEFLTAARLRWQDCAATSSTTVVRLRYWCISNLLQFGGATFLTMAMAARRKSSRILDGGNTAMSAHRQPPWQRRRATR